MQHQVQQAVEHTVLQVAKKLEDQLDQQLHQLENLQDDDIERLRQRRLDELKRQQEKKAAWLAKGHGSYTEVPSEKDFFQEMKGEERMVAHFSRETMPCKIIDKHLSILAQKHLETRFIKVNAEKSPYLTEKLKIWMLPTLALIKMEKTIDYVVGFDDLGGREDFPTEVLAARLAQQGLIFYEEGQRYSAAQHENEKSIRKGIYVSGADEDSDFEE